MHVVNNIGDGGAGMISEALTVNTKLAKLNIFGIEYFFSSDLIIIFRVLFFCSGNKIGVEGARLISDALKKNSTLIELNLGGGPFGSELLLMTKECEDGCGRLAFF